MATQRITREIAIIKKNPIDGVEFEFNDDDIHKLSCVITGAKGTPYEDGKYIVGFRLPVNYPHEPPKVLFATKIYHPNINPIGQVCLNILKASAEDGWLPSYTVKTVVIAIQALMSSPNTADPLNNEAAANWISNIELAHSIAKEWRDLYAM